MTTSRERMLEKIRAGLKHAGPQLQMEAAAVPHTAPAYVHPIPDDQTDLVTQFAIELKKLECVPHTCADSEEALEVIAKILEQLGARSILAWDLAEVGLPGLAELLAARGIQVEPANTNGAGRAAALQSYEPIPVCISGAEAGIAESATVIVRSGPGRPRLASLLPPAYIAVLRREQIARGLGEAFSTIRARYGSAVFEQSSSLVCITGPSRTADIELTLTLGVHGPREVHVVLVG